MLERTAGFLDLVGVCHAVVATTKRVVSGARGRTLSGDEQAALAENIAWAKAALG